MYFVGFFFRILDFFYLAKWRMSYMDQWSYIKFSPMSLSTSHCSLPPSYLYTNTLEGDLKIYQEVKMTFFQSQVTFLPQVIVTNQNFISQNGKGKLNFHRSIAIHATTYPYKLPVRWWWGKNSWECGCKVFKLFLPCVPSCRHYFKYCLFIKNFTCQM